MTDFNRPIHCVLGLPIDALTLNEAARRLEHARSSGERCFFSTPNLNFVVASRSNPVFRDSVCRSDMSLADGMPLIWVARLLGIPLPERVSGSGLFEHLRKFSSRQWRVFFFGGQLGVGQTACLAIGGADAAIRPTGYIYPGMESVQDMSRTDLIDCINESQSDLLVVSLGAAKGQEWISSNLGALKTPVISHLGAVINFVAGSVARAPLWMQRSGLEWLWRIKEEPQLYKRYWHDGLGLLWLLATRVLPLAIRQRLGAAPESDYARATIDALPGKARLALHGAWRADNLSPLRAEFARLEASGSDVELDLQDTSDFDSAFVGLLLLLNQAVLDRGHTLRLTHLSPRLKHLLHLHCVDHLLVT